MMKYHFNRFGLSYHFREEIGLIFQKFIKRLEVNMMKKNYDEWKFRKDVKTLGCRPPTYIGFNTTLPKCVDSRDLAKAINMTTSKNDTNPCQMVDKVIFSYDEMDGIPGVMDKLIEERNGVEEKACQ